MDDLISVAAEYEVADVSSALFLSGGVDSTFLAAATQSLDCFHLVSPETDYAREVARRFDRRFVCVEPELDSFADDVAQVTRFHGEPLMSCGIPCAVSKEIASHGYKMAISANGADELFHGYPRTPIPEYEPEYLPLHESATYRWLADQIAHIFRDNRNFRIEEFDEFIPSLQSIGNNALSAYNLTDFPPSASHRWFELMTYVLHDLNPTLDAASMIHSLEVRVPFLDHRIVEGVLSWSGETLVTPTEGRKAPLKRFLSQYFPLSFFNREKLGFSLDEQRLRDIALLGNKALRNARKSGFIRFIPDARYGEYSRDLILLGASLYAYDAWKASDLFGKESIHEGVAI